jgi:hypothetical protein
MTFSKEVFRYFVFLNYNKMMEERVFMEEDLGLRLGLCRGFVMMEYINDLGDDGDVWTLWIGQKCLRNFSALDLDDFLEEHWGVVEDMSKRINQLTDGRKYYFDRWEFVCGIKGNLNVRVYSGLFLNLDEFFAKMNIQYDKIAGNVESIIDCLEGIDEDLWKLNYTVMKYEGLLSIEGFTDIHYVRSIIQKDGMIEMTLDRKYEHLYKQDKLLSMLFKDGLSYSVSKSQVSSLIDTFELFCGYLKH